MSWTRIPHPARHACCPWPGDCACHQARLRPRFRVDAPAPPAPPAANRVQRRALVPADLQRSGDSWERVLRRLAAEEASRQARRRNPWYSEER